MFRDTSEELARLEAELLAEEEPVEETYEEESYEEEYWEENFTEETDEEPELSRYRVYNTDITDEDLDEYAEEVRNPSRGCSTVLVIILCLLALSIVALVALILRQGGFL